MEGRTRWLKSSVIIVGALLVFCAAIVVILLLTLDDENYRGIAVWAVERFTDYRLTMGGEFSLALSMEPSLSASEIRIESDNREQGPLSADIGHIRTKIALKTLFSGDLLIRELLVSDATVSYVKEGGVRPEEEEETDLKEKLADMKIPILENVALRNVTVSVTDRLNDQEIQFLLRSFTLDDIGETGQLTAKGEGEINAHDFAVTGTVGSVADVLRQETPYPVDLQINSADLNINLSGTVEDITKGTGMALRVTGTSRELSTPLRILKKNMPKLGQLNLEASITGNAAAPGVSDFSMNISGEPGIELSASGSITNVITGEGSDIKITGFCSNRGLIRALLPGELHELNDIRFESRLRETADDYTLENISFSVSHEKRLTGSVQGSIILDKDMEVPEIKDSHLELNITSPDTKPFRQYLPDRIPDTGPVTATARLTGPGKALSLNDITITIGKPDILQIHAEGRVGSIPFYLDQPVSDFDVMLSVLSTELQPMLTGMTDSIREWDSISARTHVTGSSDRLQFDEIVVHLEEEEGAAADITGNARVEQRQEHAPLISMDLSATLYGQSLSSFQNLLAAKALPDLKPAKASLRLSGTSEVMSLKDIVVEAGQSGALHFTWRGRIGRIAPGTDNPISDVELENSLFAENTSLLSPYVGVSLPDLGSLKGSSRIVARKDGYGADNLEFTVGKKEEILLTAKGRIDHVMRGTTVGIDGIDLAVTVSELDAQAFSESLGQQVAAMGKLSGSFSLSGRQEDLTVTNADLATISPDGLKLSLRGGVGHIRVKEKMPFQGIDMDLTAAAPGVAVIQQITGLDLPDLGPLRVRLGVHDRDDALNIDPLGIRAGRDETPTLLIEGMMHTDSVKKAVKGRLTFQSPTRLWTEKYLEQPLPEEHIIEGDLQLSGQKNNEHLEGTIHVGKTTILALIDRSLVDERARVRAQISTPKIHLSDFTADQDVAPVSGDEKKETPPVSDSRLFSDKPLPFDSLQKLDLSLDLDADETVGKGYILTDLDLDVVLDSGHLMSRIPKVTFANGFVSIESTIDTRGSKPELMLKVTAEDIDVAALLAHGESPMIRTGNLSIALDLRSAGSSPREIAAALNGKAGIAIEHGEVKQIADLVGADAIDFVTTVRRRGGYERLNCLAITVEFNDGIGKSQVFYIDTPKVRSRGKGTVDLREETIDLVIQPKPKKGQLGGSSPVHLRGSLAQPSIMKIPTREAARLTGEILMPHIFLPARALGFLGSVLLNDKDESSPCFQRQE